MRWSLRSQFWQAHADYSVRLHSHCTIVAQLSFFHLCPWHPSRSGVCNLLLTKVAICPHLLPPCPLQVLCSASWTEAHEHTKKPVSSASKIKVLGFFFQKNNSFLNAFVLTCLTWPLSQIFPCLHSSAACSPSFASLESSQAFETAWAEVKSSICSYCRCLLPF